MSPRERIFETIKEEMIKNIESAKLETIHQVDNLNKELFGYAHYLVEVPNLMEPTEVDKPTKSNIIDIPEYKDTPELKEMNEVITSKKDQEIKEDNEPIPEKYDDDLNVGILKRGLANGHIHTQDDESIFIPESIIRKHDYNHGDIIRFEPMIDRPDSNHYYFTLIQKSKDVNTNRVTLDNGVVMYDYTTGEHYVRQNLVGESITSQQDELNRYVIPENDIQDYLIEPNSIVDLAWYKGNVINTIKVIWRH